MMLCGVMTAAQRVAQNLRRLRVARGVSQEALALDAEIDRTYVSRLERLMENPTVNVVERLAMALGVPIEVLFMVPDVDSSAERLKSGRKPGSRN